MHGDFVLIIKYWRIHFFPQNLNYNPANKLRNILILFSFMWSRFFGVLSLDFCTTVFDPFNLLRGRELNKVVEVFIAGTVSFFFEIIFWCFAVFFLLSFLLVFKTKKNGNNMITAKCLWTRNKKQIWNLLIFSRCQNICNCFAYN